MQASRLRNSISYGLILIFAIVVARQIPALAGSFALGALLRLILLPIVVLLALLLVVQNWELIRAGGWGISRCYLPSMKSTFTFILPTTLLIGVLMACFGEALNLVSLPVLILVIVLYFLSLHFIMTGKEHYAFALLLLSMPCVDFVSWDIGKPSGLFKVQIGHITLEIKVAYILISSLFGVWAARMAVRRRFQLTEFRRYVPLLLWLLWSLASILLITYSHNMGYAVNRIASMFIFPLLLYIMLVETIETKDKFRLMVYSAIAMVVLYTFVNYYMSYRTLGMTFEITEMADNYGLIKYGTGSPTVVSVELGLIAPMLLALLITETDRRYVLLLIGLVILTAVGLLAGSNRGAMLAAAAGSTFLLRNRRVQLLAIMALVIAWVFWEPIYNYALIRFHDIHSFADLNMRNLAYSRYQGWIAAVGMLREHPILGVGLNNFGDYAHLFSAPYWANPPIGKPYLVYMSDAHNLFLEVAAELGFIGLGILLVFFGMLLLDLMRGMSAVKGSKLAPFGWGLLGVYVVTIVLSITADGFWVAKSSLGHNVLYWTFFALMGRLRCIGKRDELRDDRGGLSRGKLLG